MAIGLACSCGNVLVATPALAGKTVPCAACGKGIAVPGRGGPARAKAPARMQRPEAVAEEAPPSSLPMVLGIGAGLVVIVGLLVGLVAWCYSGGPKEQSPDGLAQVIPSADKKPDQGGPLPPQITPKKDDRDPPFMPPPKKDPIVPKPIVDEPSPKNDPVPPVDSPKDPPTEKKDPPKKEVLPPTDPPKEIKSVLPPLKNKPPSAFIVPIFVTEDFKEAKLPYKVRYLKLPENFKPKTLRLAVTPPNFDDMGKLLDDLGDGFRYTNITNDHLASMDRLKEFDVVFLTCGAGHPLEAPVALRKFVEGGGTLYASDLRYDLILDAFPEMKAPYQVLGGNGMQVVRAEIVDSGLKQYLGKSTLMLQFNLDGWKPAVFNKAKSKSLMEGKYWPEGGAMQQILARLLVKFRAGEGTVIFTSFHNAAQNNEVERKLLKYLVFQAVIAKSETKVQDLLVKEGFALVEMKSHQLSTGKKSPEQKLSHAKGGLQFAVGYDTLGAKLRLTLTAPDGQKIEHEDSAMFLLEIPNAPTGQWTYSVTATSVPFANFPFVLAVGKKN